VRWLVVDKPPGNKHRSENLRLEFGQVQAFAVLLCSHAIVTLTGKPMAMAMLCGNAVGTCRDLLLERSYAGEDLVGTDIAIRHIAPTLVGMSVEIKVTVNAVEGRKVSFEISAKDEIEPICSGTHGRFVVDVGKTIERLKAKAANRTSKTG
jgi:predicted thioesterase